VSFRPTEDQRRIANAFSASAQLLSRPSRISRLERAVGQRFGEPRAGQLVAQVAARQAEFGRSIVDTFRVGRFTAASALTRSLLEMTVWICWPLADSDLTVQRERLVRLVVDQYRAAMSRGQAVPPDASALVRGVAGRAARKPPSFEDMLIQLDRHEAEAEGGISFWSSHASLYSFTNRHVHPSMYGPLYARGAGSDGQLVGATALVYGHQHLALAASACAIYAQDQDLETRIAANFAAVRDLQRAELHRHLDGDEEPA
jgi:hypothetical protein